jgi:hypothetical protein
MEPKNNIVDITNFVMIEYGQTMHARTLPNSKVMTSLSDKPRRMKSHNLLGTEVKLDNDIFVLTPGGEVTGIEYCWRQKQESLRLQSILFFAGNYDFVYANICRIKIMNESVSRNDKFQTLDS